MRMRQIATTGAAKKRMTEIMRTIKRCNRKIQPDTNVCACAEFIYAKIAEAAETGEMPT